MLLLALMCMDSAMPWGGKVIIARKGQGWRLEGQASRTRPEPSLWRWLEAAQTPNTSPAPSEVHFAVLGALAADHRRPVTWRVDAGGAELSF